MPDPIVLDASAALALLRAEPSGAAVARALEEATRGDAAILVPDHFWLEVVNVLARRYGWEADAIVAAVHGLDELGIVTVAIERPIVLLALDHVARDGLTAYDAAYLALAEVAAGALLTLDGPLAEAAGDRAIGRRPKTTGEARAAYGTQPAPPTWSAHGRYLAELRRRASEGAA